VRKVWRLATRNTQKALIIMCTSATRATAGGISESRLYFTVVWCMVAFGSAILLLGFDQPLVLVTISTVLGVTTAIVAVNEVGKLV
jgi:hypothetical protein